MIEKGFGQQEPSIDDICKSGISYHKQIAEIVKKDSEGNQLLAKAVMKFTYGPKESDLVYGRIAVGHIINNIVELANGAGVHTIHLHNTLRFLIDTPMEELKAMGL